ncbi:MAG: hypothetical protein O8C55_06905 [Candidatus Methanoperedens sp.]|nr:hypothetical protein [Candidatus Methanoperedens sp.]
MKGDKIVFGIVALLLSAGPGGASTLNVGPGEEYSTIQSAVNSANYGDIVSVSEGTYYENPVIKKNGILILGKNKEKTILDGKKSFSGFRIDGASNVTISGFTIQNTWASGKEDAGITLYRANNNMIANIILIGNVVGISLYGLFVFSSNDNKNYNNNIQGNQIGIYADSARSSSIYSNNFIGNRDQAYDNSGLNAWDDGKSGNHWSNLKGGEVYNLPGGAKARDNHPLAGAVAIKEVVISTPAEKPQAQMSGKEMEKSSPGLPGIAVLVSLIILVRTIRKN